MMSEEEDGERRMLGEEEQRLFNDPLPVVSDSVLGKRKQLTRLNSWEWSFAAISVVNVVACIVLSAIRLAEVINERKHSPDFTFTMLLIINSAFCLFYVVHGLLKELQYEIYVLILAILVVLVYCIIEYTVNTEGHSRIKEVLRMSTGAGMRAYPAEGPRFLISLPMSIASPSDLSTFKARL